MKYPGFIGPAYRTRSKQVSADRLVNLFAEPLEVPNQKAQWNLYGTPGRTEFCDLVQYPVRALFHENGRAFAVAGVKLLEVFSDGTFTDRGVVGNTNPPTPAQIVSSGTQLLIRSGTNGYIFELGSNVLTQIAGWLDGGGAQTVCMIDGYFLAGRPASRRFDGSGLLDGLSWGGLDFALKEGSGDNLCAVVAHNRQLWLLGYETGEVWVDTPNLGTNFPFQRIDGVFLEVGCVAPNSPQVIDNSLFWLAGSARGGYFVVKAEGYTPKRISSFAIEYAISTYSRVDDAIAFAYEEEGHSFYVLIFPAGNATWVYDPAADQWHERMWWDSAHSTENAIRQRSHCFAFGKHLVGDYATGQIYDQSLNYLDDDGDEIRRIRVAPALFNENKRLTIHRLEVLLQTGVGIPGSGQGSAPVMGLELSNDGGYTWGPILERDMGQLGAYEQRVFWTRLGQARNRVVRVSCSEPIPQVWVDAYLQVTPGTS